MNSSALAFLSSVIAIIFAVSVHEFFHAWVADRLGDPTARIYGRLTINPLKHFDLIGTLCLIFLGIGWGKPVPFNPENLRHPKRDSALIALAGPFSNLVMAFIAALPLKYLAGTSVQALPLYLLLQYFFYINVLLFSLNVLPFPPFDGSKIFGILVPRRYYHLYERYLQNGMMYVIIFILFDIFVIEKVFGFSILGIVVATVSTWVRSVIYLAT